MEFNTDNIFSMKKKIFESTHEQSLDTDFSLPDYYPEITKVLKCLCDISILSAQCSEVGLNIGGQAVITLLYADKDNEINSFIHKCPFAKQIESEDVKTGYVTVIPKLNYLNCKATGPRKIDVHGSIGLNICITDIEEKELFCGTDCEGIYSKTLDIECIKPIVPVSKSVYVEDDIIIPETKPSIGKIIRQEAKARASECKFISGKAVVKGDVQINILYCPVGSVRPVLIKEERSFSQIVECDFAEEINFNCSARVDSLELYPKQSSNDEVRNISFEAKVTVELFPFGIEKKKIVSDCFSGKYIADISFSDIVAEHVADKINENYVCKKTIDFSGGMLKEVYDLWCNVTVDHASDKGGEILIKGAVILNVLGVDNGDEPVFFERPIDYEYRYNVGEESEGFGCDPKVSIVAVNHSFNADASLEVAAELNIKATVFACQTVKAVTKVNVDKNNKISKEENSALTLYFAEKETVWDIAKKYRSSPEVILAVNSMTDIDEECSKTLLIPNI